MPKPGIQLTGDLRLILYTSRFHHAILLPHLLLKLHDVNNSALPPRLLCGEHSNMAPQGIGRVRAEQGLVLGPDGLDERADEARVAAAVVPTLALGRVERGLARPEVGDGKRAHVADDLPEREVDARLALALQLIVRDHRERGRRPSGELNVHDLYRFEVQGVATGSRRGFM